MLFGLTGFLQQGLDHWSQLHPKSFDRGLKPHAEELFVTRLLGVDDLRGNPALPGL
jgi:hypothetical protein